MCVRKFDLNAYINMTRIWSMTITKYLGVDGCECVRCTDLCKDQKETCFSHFATDGGDFVPVCRAIAKEVS